MLYEFQFDKDPVFGGAVVDPSPLPERADGLVGKDARGVGSRCCRGSVGKVSPRFLNGLVHLFRSGNGSVVVFLEINNVDPDLTLLIFYCSSNSEILLKQTVFVVYGTGIGNSNAVDVSGPDVIVDRRFGNVGVRFLGVEVERRCDVGRFAFFKTDPFLYNCDRTLVGLVGYREIIYIIGSGAAGQILVDECLYRFAVDGDGSLFVDDDRVVLVVKKESFGSFEFS